MSPREVMEDCSAPSGSTRAVSFVNMPLRKSSPDESRRIILANRIHHPTRKTPGSIEFTIPKAMFKATPEVIVHEWLDQVAP